MVVVEEKLAEAVRKYTVLYDKADKFFKDRNKKRLAWEDATSIPASSVVTASCHDKRRWDRGWGGCCKGGKFYIF